MLKVKAKLILIKVVAQILKVHFPKNFIKILNEKEI